MEVIGLYHATHVEPQKKIFSTQISWIWSFNVIFIKGLYLMSWSTTDVLSIRRDCSWKSKLTGSCFWFTSMIFWRSLQTSISGLSSYLPLICLWIPNIYKNIIIILTYEPGKERLHQEALSVISRAEEIKRLSFYPFKALWI